MEATDSIESTLVTPEVKSIIASVAAFAPLHNRAELEGIEIVERLIGKVRQVAVFDTGFHRTLPPLAAVYPGPYAWFEQGIRRYGFHGINHEYCAYSRRAAIGTWPSFLEDRELSSWKRLFPGSDLWRLQH